MRTREANAPEKMRRRGWRIESIAAIRNVLSPISEIIIMKNAWRRAWVVVESSSSGSGGEVGESMVGE